MLDLGLGTFTQVISHSLNLPPGTSYQLGILSFSFTEKENKSQRGEVT